MSDIKLTVLSLGAGVQSSTLALMCKHGEYPAPDIAIFADTGDEPQSVYDWLEWLTPQLPFPVIIARHSSGKRLSQIEGPIRISRKTGKPWMKNLIPAFVKNPNGSRGIFGRKCTTDFKIVPINQAIRAHLGIKAFRGTTAIVKQYIGISTDEAHRMKPSQTPSIELTWPLIDLGMSRTDCFEWMKAKGYPEPPRSACVFCPFHSDHEWRRLRDDEPAAFAAAVEHEQQIQHGVRQCERVSGIPYLHASLIPLDEVDFDEVDSRSEQLSLFGNECEGLCGV